MRTPVALIIFNRPHHTARVFAEIAKARPERLFLIADGPRSDRPEDVQRCAAVRDIVAHVAWPCQVERNFAESNLGCGRRNPPFAPRTSVTRMCPWSWESYDAWRSPPLSTASSRPTLPIKCIEAMSRCALTSPQNRLLGLRSVWISRLLRPWLACTTDNSASSAQRTIK
jgi:hypothetical protein